jgi:hypothetical protein
MLLKYSIFSKFLEKYLAKGNNAKKSQASGLSISFQQLYDYSAKVFEHHLLPQYPYNMIHTSFFFAIRI